jgi:hypothetical protein
MARASKIFIIIRLEYHTLAYYYMTLRLKHSWLEPQRFYLSQARASYSSLLLFDFDAQVFMAGASTIIIILTLRPERSWLEPQRLSCLIIIPPGIVRMTTG